MKRIFIISILLLGISYHAAAQKGELKLIDTLTNEFLDTVIVKKKLKLNDYSMIGVQYGAALSQVMWNPSQKQQMLLMPMNLGVTYTLYGKMFGSNKPARSHRSRFNR